MVMPRELDVAVGGRRVRVRDAGDRLGSVVLFLHGLGDSRLDLRLGEPLAQRRHVRLVSLDRPGYGLSTPTEFDLLSVARDVEAVADHLGLQRLALFGQSAGSRFALAAAAVLGDRVTRLACASGNGPVRMVPGALDELDDLDRSALALLPEDRSGAARLYAEAMEPMATNVRDGERDEVLEAFRALLAPADLVLLADPLILADAVSNARESLRQGAIGMAWDAVTWLDDWPFALRDISCPVRLWYGEHDTTPLAHARWLSEGLPDARLTVWAGGGHLAYKRHLDEVLAALVEDSAI